MTSDEGCSLAACAGQVVSLRMDAERIPALAENVSAFKGSSFENRLLVCAHIDAKPGSPGAADNGGGTTVLLLLAELLRNYQGSRGIEILAINGEDHYSAGGEMEYLRRHRDALGQIGLVINLDGVGLSGDPTGLSSYECPEAISAAALKVASSFPSIRQMDPWFQGDHMVFAMNGVPALALTTCGFLRMESDYAHTSKDNIEIMDAALLADAALFLEKLIDEVLP
jgi:aminopeptidase YwaD